MSTYLVAFIVGEFDFVEGTTEDGVKVRVFTPVGKSDQGNFALEVLIMRHLDASSIPFFHFPILKSKEYTLNYSLS